MPLRWHAKSVCRSQASSGDTILGPRIERLIARHLAHRDPLIKWVERLHACALIRGFDVHDGALHILNRRLIDDAERSLRFLLCARKSVCSEDRAHEPERDDLHE